MKYDKRIKTYHGIVVPPWNQKAMGKNMTFVFVVRGKIPSKKNQLVAVVDRKDAFAHLNSLTGAITKKDCIALLFKTFGRVKNSLVYEKWEEETVELLKGQLVAGQRAAEKNGIIFPLSRAAVNIYFYWKGRYRRDNSNKAEGLHDAMVKANILLDDSDKVMPNTCQYARDYTDEITESMAVIYVTTPIKKAAN